MHQGTHPNIDHSVVQLSIICWEQLEIATIEIVKSNVKISVVYEGAANPFTYCMY